MGKIIADRMARYLALIERERETLEELAVRVAEGESLKAVCAAWDIPVGRFGAWLAADPRRRDIYEGARQLRADALADEILEIADGKAGSQGDHLRDALSIRARQWVASKWDRSRYGDSVVVQHQGETVVRLTFGERTIASAPLVGESSVVEDGDI